MTLLLSTKLPGERTGVNPIFPAHDASARDDLPLRLVSCFGRRPLGWLVRSQENLLHVARHPRKFFHFFASAGFLCRKPRVVEARDWNGKHSLD